MTEQARYAVLIPVGGKAEQTEGAADLLSSLTAYGPGAACVAMVDDAWEPRGLANLFSLPAACEAVAISNPRRGRGHCRHGGLCTGLLAGLRELHRRGPFDFVLKMDTDALAIATFAPAVAKACEGSVGLVGTVGRTCRREDPAYGAERLTPSPLIGAGWIDKSLQPVVSMAVANGYSWLEYCQGGAYAMSWPMVEALHRQGLLDDPLPWMNAPVGEDVIFGMLARALGFELRDLSASGEPFAVQSMGLAYAPEELAARGYGLIHSTRKDARWREPEIRRYFAERRSAAAA